MNRGLARRTVFETAADARFFLSRLARAVRRGEIEVHAYALLTTHFHLLVRSPTGRLAEALRRMQNEFVRHFNRGRRRDGALFSGRFRSKPVETLTYRIRLLCYIDQNAPQARLAAHSAAYPFGSAFHYARSAGPPWLERSWVESAACEISGRQEYSPAAYVEAFGDALPPALMGVVERRLRHAATEPDPLDDIIGQAPDAVRAWMRRKAALADGTSPGLPILEADQVERVVNEALARNAAWVTRPARKRVDAWRLARVAMFRDLCGLSYTEIAARLAANISSVRTWYLAHRAAMGADPEYARRFGDLAEVAMSVLRPPDPARIVQIRS